MVTGTSGCEKTLAEALRSKLRPAVLSPPRTVRVLLPVQVEISAPGEDFASAGRWFCRILAA